MEKRVAVVAIIAEDRENAGEINGILHEYNNYIIGRMGLPYRDRQVNIISVVVDAPPDIINAMAGKLGRIKGVTAKAVCSGII